MREELTSAGAAGLARENPARGQGDEPSGEKGGSLTGAAPFVGPFAVFVCMMAAERSLGLPIQWMYPVRCAATLLALLYFSRKAIPLRASAPLVSAAIGVAVFLIWIGPDVLFGAAYRHSWIFENALLGKAGSSAPESLRSNLPFIIVRILGCVAIVPVIEELFWRGWLMRWLIGHDFRTVAIGAYTAPAFWITAAFFACEHGPYWEVGLAAGIVYNLLVVRAKNLGDCIVAHAVTNGILSAYVLMTGNWQYWM
jgi:uncharacterized protein